MKTIYRKKITVFLAFGRLKGGCSDVSDKMDLGKPEGIPKKIYLCALHFGFVSGNVYFEPDICNKNR